MDFFSRQEDVQTRSRVFGLAFALAIVVTVFVFYFAVTLGFLALFRYLPPLIYGSPQRILALRPFLIVGSLITLVIFAASSYKIRAVRKGGGAYLAAALGGEPVETPKSEAETRLLNVVEEMAVAAGLPRPRVHILPRESTINAVTAGLDPEDAVIVVTNGALTHLNREELRAVVAHEFAHIQNGDFVLNLNMAGWLYGLLFFSTVGQDWLDDSLDALDKILRGVYYGSMPRWFSVFGIGAGFLLMVGGWLGRVAAGTVQAAFSRQREYLADAYAVQFTRETAALAGALKKIAGLPKPGLLRSGQAALMKAFFIVAPTRADGLLKTHPPLERRILLLEPDWDGEFIHLDHPDFRPPELRPDFVMKVRHPFRRTQASDRGPGSSATRAAERFQELWPGALSALALLNTGGGREACSGKPPEPRLQETGPIFEPEMPAELARAACDPARTAAAVVAACLPGGSSPELPEPAQAGLSEATAAAVLELRPLIEDEMKLPLLETAAPALAGLAPEERERLRCTLLGVLTTSGRLDFFGLAVNWTLKKALGPLTGPAPEAPVGLADYLETMKRDVTAVLSALAHLEAESPEAAEGAFAAGLAHFGEQWPPLPLVPPADDPAGELIPVLDRLSRAPDGIRRSLALAAVSTALSHGRVGRPEYYLLRALSATLNIPLPMSFPG